MKEFNGSKISLMLIVLLGMAAVSLAVEDTWTTKANMPTARYVLSSSVVDGIVYAIGGDVGYRGSVVEAYDALTDTWTRKTNMPMGRGAGASGVVNERIYYMGGRLNYNEANISSVIEYDATTDTWAIKANMMPTPRTWLSSSVVNGKIYAIGGALTYQGTPLSTVEEYDPATDTWTTKADMPTARACLSTSAVNGKIYAIGGTLSDPYYQGLSTVEEYDPATDTWTSKADMPTGRTYFSTCAVNGKIYAVGGVNSHGSDHIPPVEEYDPATDTWTTKADMPTARSGLTTSAVNGKIYAIGGWVGSGTAVSTVEEYTPPKPVVIDFDGDGRVDFKDFAIFAQSAYDGGELHGRGLAALAEHWLEDIGLVAHWNLDEQDGGIAYDSAGDNDGTLNGDPNWQPTAGSVDGAIELDGEDDYVSTDFVLDPADGPFSVYAWVKAGAPEQVVISQVGETGRSWLAADSEGNLMTDIRAPVGRLFGPPLVSDFLITDGDWHRIALVWDGSYRHLHADGGEVAVDIEDQIALVGDDGGLYFGAENTLSATGFFDGMIDDIRIYDQAVHWLEDLRLLAHWKLDEEDGTVAHDSAGDANGIVHGDPNWQPTAGSVDGAIELDGEDDYVSTDFVLNPADGPFSVYAWVKAGFSGQVVISQTNSTEVGPSWLAADLSGCLITTVTPPGRMVLPLISEFVMTDGDWHHIGLIWDGSHRFLYADEAEVAKDAEIRIGLVGATGGLHFGAAYDLEATSFFDGMIDDIRIYDEAVTP